MSNEGAFAAMNTAIQVVQEQRALLTDRADQWSNELTDAMRELSSVSVDTPATARAPLNLTPPNAVVDLDRKPSSPAIAGHSRDGEFPSDTKVDAQIDRAVRGLDQLGDDFSELPPPPVMPALDFPQRPVLNLPDAPADPGIDYTVNLPAPPAGVDSVTQPVMEAVPAFIPPDIAGLQRPLPPQIDWTIGMPDPVTLQMPDMGGLRQIPDIHEPTMPRAPDAVAIDTHITMPADPVFDLPQLRGLKEIPDFTLPELVDFDGKPPTLELTAPNVFINWAEPVYESEVMDDLVAWVRRYMQGGTGLPAHVEDALFARSRDRLTAETRKGVQEAVNTWAARGFSMPSGMLARDLSVIREAGRDRAAELNRDTMIEAAKWEQENIRFAVERGIAIEGLLQNLHENTAKRLFEAARFGAEAQINVFNAQISLHNAQIQGFNAYQQAFRIKLDRALALLEVWKTRAQAVTSHNQNTVEILKAEYIAVEKAVDIYRTQMEGAKARAAVIESQINLRRADIQAYAETVNAEKVKVEVQDSRIRAIVAANQNEVEVFRAKLAGEQQRVEMFKALMEGARSRAQVLASQVDAYRAEVQSFGELVGAEKLSVEAQEAQARVILANNQNASEIYKSQLAFVQSKLEQFSTLMDGAKVQAGIVESRVNARRAEIQAYAETLNAAKTEADIFESQTRAEATKGQLFDSASRNFANVVQAISAKSDVKLRAKQVEMEGAKLVLQGYQSDLEAWRAKVDADLRAAALEVQSFQAQAQMWSSGANISVATAEMGARVIDMHNKTNLQFAEVQTAEFAAKAQHAMQKVQVAMESAKAIAQFSAQLVAGAMSAINISAGVSGDGRQSGSYSRNDNYSYEGN